MMQPTPRPLAPTPGALLRESRLPPDIDLTGLHGFGGVHGGLLLALVAGQLAKDAGDHPLRYVTGQFLRSSSGELRVTTDEAAAGRSVVRARGRVVADRHDTLTASAVFGHDSASGTRPEYPPMPSVASPDRCEPFAIPTEFVPFTRHLEIRPTDDHRPFVGGEVATLTAWIRLVEDDEAPDALRLITLLDALAPSYAAVLSELVAIPTIELSVRISSRGALTPSPWILLRASTLLVDGDWLDERIDAWAPTGDHLAAANQVRLVRR